MYLSLHMLVVQQMLSGLDFKQDNKIGDDPVVDLLKYLNEKLERAVTTARLPSGQNPLEQLILIIGDGRFNEQVLTACFYVPLFFLRCAPHIWWLTMFSFVA